MQLVVDGAEQRGAQGADETSTHRRDERPDEIAQWRNATETCAPHAYRRLASATNYMQLPSVQKLLVHSPRKRDPTNPKDVGLTDFEVYLARPLLARNVRLGEGEAESEKALRALDTLRFEHFFKGWLSGTEKTAPKRKLLAGTSRPEPLPEALAEAGVVAYRAAGGQLVYHGTDPTGLRSGTVQGLPPRLYWQRRSESTVRHHQPPRARKRSRSRPGHALSSPHLGERRMRACSAAAVCR